MSNSLATAGESLVETSHRGLTYPFGRADPLPGTRLTVAPGVHWARMPMPGSLGHINVWLLDDGDDIVIVDTAFESPSCREAWEGLLTGPFASRRASQVIVTHFHPDHVGLAGWLCARFAAPLVMTRAEFLTARLLAADARDATPDEVIAFWRAAGWDEAQVERACARGWKIFRSFVAPLPMAYRRIEDGDRIEIGGVSWEVVVGSGHSPEHACLVDPVGGVLIAGDQVLPRISSNISLSMAEPEGDPLGDWLASIARLRVLPDTLLVCPSHGEPFTGLHARLDAMRDEHLMRLNILVEHLTEPRRAVDCFGRMFRRVIDGDSLGLATGETLAHLRRLEIEGRAIKEIRDGVWWYRAA